jgi:aryl-alcohol dehydrogenase-like predicted oxidoreductase
LVGLMTITPVRRGQRRPDYHPARAFPAGVHLVVERARAKEPAAPAGHAQRERPVDPQPGGLHADGRVASGYPCGAVAERTGYDRLPGAADVGGGMPGLTVARIALGCGNFGGVGSAPEFFGQGLTEDQAFGLMDAAWASGITSFDTADAYGGGRSEQAIGRWIRSRGVRPRLTTKTFNPMQTGEDQGLQPDRIARQLRSSLDRLGVDRVDLYLAHDYDPAVPLAESLGAFRAAEADGLIGAYGVSNFDARQLAAALAAGAPQAIQNSYSLLTRQDEAELLPLCAERGVAYLAFSPLAGGWLTGKYRRGAAYPADSRMTQRPEPYQEFVTGRTFEALARLQAIATGRGTSMAGLALAWLLADERVAQVVIGPGRPEHLAPVAEALEHPVTDQERGTIEAAVAGVAPPGAPHGGPGAPHGGPRAPHGGPRASHPGRPNGG